MCHIGSKFCKFYLNKIGFTLGELAYLVEGFRVFRLKEVFWYSECEHNRLEIKLEILGFFFLKVWEGGGNGFLGFEICGWGKGLCDEPSQLICLLWDSFDLGYGNGYMWMGISTTLKTMHQFVWLESQIMYPSNHLDLVC